MSIERRIKELQDANNQMRRLKNEIGECDKAIKLVTRQYGRYMNGNPTVTIRISDYDDFDDDDEVAQVVFEAPNDEEAQPVVALINKVKDTAAAKLSSLQKKYGK